MARGPASPIEIATSQQNSNSPRNQQSNLTSQFQQPRIDVEHHGGIMLETQNQDESQYPGRQEFVGMLGTTPYGARSIPIQGDMSRDSNALAGSLMNGLSWGALSVGSVIRDDMIMTGTSPYNYQSPSFQSSSYLPKMEARYMKDYVCCDIKLDSMHELLQHYEEAHAVQPTDTMGWTCMDPQYPSSQAANAISTAQAIQQQSQAQPPNLPVQLQQQPPQQPQNPNLHTSPLFSGQSADQVDFENLDNMEMDTDGASAKAESPQGAQFQPQPSFGRQQPRGPSVNVSIANAFQGQGLQTPTTPRAGQANIGGLPHNPTVSSVNTPTLSTRTTSRQTATPDSSMPGTPAEPADFDCHKFGKENLGCIDYSRQLAQKSNLDWNSLNSGTLSQTANAGSGTIDDPAKHLLSKTGYGRKGVRTRSNDSELAKRIRESQLLKGLAGVGGFVDDEIKPFNCPVIGCERTYKNQNGLKYHRHHAHQNQQLKANPDGTLSIVDPATSIPYPGTVGMEIQKPFRCEVCGKRYKNLNGLKYHRHHTPPCNPDSRLNTANLQAMANNVQGMNANVAGGGLMRMTDGMTGY